MIHRTEMTTPLVSPAARTVASAHYSVRRLDMAELPQANDLYNRCHRASRPLVEAEWLYRRNPYGEGIILGAFDQDGRLVGMRPAIARRFFWDGKEKQAYQFTDAVVAPEHRNRGIFGRLVDSVCVLGEKEDFALFSFPNEHSLSVYRRTPSLAEAGVCEVQVRILSWLPYLRWRLDGHGAVRQPQPAISRAPLEARGLGLVPVDRFDSDFDGIHAALASRVASFTLRRREFLNWRYFGSPTRTYHVALVERWGQPQGYVAFRLVDRIAHVVDLFLSPDPRLAERTLALVTRWARQSGAIAVYFKASQGHPFRRALRGVGSLAWLTREAIVLDRASVDHLASSRGRRIGIEDFYFTMGDGDFF